MGFPFSSIFPVGDLIKKIINNFTLQRITSAGIVFLCSFLLAKILGPQKFGYLAFVLYLTKLFLNVNFGAISGYIYGFFSSSGDLLKCRFPLYYFIHLMVIVLIILAGSQWLGQNYRLASMLFIGLIPVFVLEPLLRVHKYFYISLIPDLLLYGGATFAMVVFPQTSSLPLMVVRSLGIMLILTTTVLIFIVRDKKSILMTSWSQHSHGVVKDMKVYFSLIRNGFTLFLGTIAFTLFLFVDRFFLERFHDPSCLGIYMFSFQLTMGVGIVVSSQNFVNMISIGEIMKGSHAGGYVRSKFLWSLILGCLSFGLLVTVSIIIENAIMPEYRGLTFYCIPLGLGFFAFHVSGSITPILLYTKKQVLPTTLMIIAALLCVMTNIAILHFHVRPSYLPWFTGTWLLMYSITTIFYAMAITKRIAK